MRDAARGRSRLEPGRIEPLNVLGPEAIQRKRRDLSSVQADVLLVAGPRPVADVRADRIQPAQQVVADGEAIVRRKPAARQLPYGAGQLLLDRGARCPVVGLTS